VTDRVFTTKPVFCSFCVSEIFQIVPYNNVDHLVMLNIAYLPILLQVTKDIVTCFFHEDSCDIHLNHADLLGAIWSWTGIKVEHRVKVAEVC
jgi:hypothetical protein